MLYTKAIKIFIYLVLNNTWTKFAIKQDFVSSSSLLLFELQIVIICFPVNCNDFLYDLTEYMAVYLETFPTYLQNLSTNDTNRRLTKEIMMLGLCLWKGCCEWCMVIIFRIAFRCQNWQLFPQTAGVQADRQDDNNNQQKVIWGVLYSTMSVFDYVQSEVKWQWKFCLIHGLIITGTEFNHWRHWFLVPFRIWGKSVQRFVWMHFFIKMTDFSSMISAYSPRGCSVWASL